MCLQQNLPPTPLLFSWLRTLILFEWDHLVLCLQAHVNGLRCQACLVGRGMGSVIGVGTLDHYYADKCDNKCDKTQESKNKACGKRHIFGSATKGKKIKV